MNAERAALALAEAVARLSDREDPVPDAVWKEAARHYNEQELGALVIAIGLVNLWNRVNVSTRQAPGERYPPGGRVRGRQPVVPRPSRAQIPPAVTFSRRCGSYQ